MSDSSVDENPEEIFDITAYTEAKKSVQNYLQEKRIAIDACPLEYWKENRDKWPKLCQVKFKILQIYIFLLRLSQFCH